jgi:hypothetical protein
MGTEYRRVGNVCGISGKQGWYKASIWRGFQDLMAFIEAGRKALASYDTWVEIEKI